MPRSPITLLLGLAIVAAYFLFLLWPGGQPDVSGWQAMIALSFVIGIFSWSAVRDAAPFDDRSFHRTLPPGDGFAYRRVLTAHGWVLVGIALAVIVYCWVFNFGWQVTSYGIAFLTMPVCGLMGAAGIAASLASSRQNGRIWGYFAIFGTPVFSATWLYWQRDNFDREWREEFYFSALRTMALAGSFLYLLVWWLVSVKRRRAWGFGLAAAIGALMPWIFIYGGFVSAPEAEVNPKLPIDSQVTLSRKAAIPPEGKWIPVNDVISVDGLRMGQFVGLAWFWVKSGEGTSHRGGAWEISDDPAEADASAAARFMVGGRVDGEKIEWGVKAIWNHLDKRIPSHETFEFWDRASDTQTHFAFLRSGETVIRPSKRGAGNKGPREIRSKMTEKEFTSETWLQAVGEVFQMDQVGEIDAATGGTCRLPGGGIYKVGPLQQEGGRYSISFDVYVGSLWQSDGPWFGADESNTRWGGEPWVIALDESHQHAFALSPLTSMNRQSLRIMLGKFAPATFDAGEGKTREELARLEMLRHCKIYIFWSRATGSLAEEVPPAK